MVCGLVLLLVAAGCQTPTGGSKWRHGRRVSHERIRRVACVYGKTCWLNLDKAGDRDPEGLRYRVFLDPGSGRGVLADGTFHVAMYLLERGTGGAAARTLVSDWHYPTADVHTIKKPGFLGDGYWLHLMWAKKDLAGKEIEIITEFEDVAGKKIRSGTKRFRVPKYTT